MRTKKNAVQNLVLKYTGCLDGAKSIYLHYGLGDSWENVTECKMRKLKSCYKAEVTIPYGAELRFCFRDGDGNWDNNYGADYCYSTVEEDEPVNVYSSVEVGQFTPKSVK